jgi:hypothetical protein
MSETELAQMVQEASIELLLPSAEASDLDVASDPDVDSQVGEKILARIEAGPTEREMAAIPDVALVDAVYARVILRQIIRTYLAPLSDSCR